MKLEPFALLASIGATGAASINRGDPNPMEFLAAIIVGGFLALCHSLWKSKQRKADGIDTAYWAAIALCGTMGLAYFLAPQLEGRNVPIVNIIMTKPLAGFLIAVGGTPAIEWLLTGEAFTWIRKWGDKLTSKGGVT